MNTDFEGFVVYNKVNNKKKAFAVVSEGYECKAEISNIPKKFKDYIVPIEDKRFYNHIGIDIKGTTRAFLRNFVNMKVLEGGSTISQQLARNLLKNNSKTLNRKIKESIKAVKLEYNYSKDDILNLYFNNVYFGKNLRGIRSASLYYFDKEPEKLCNKEILFLITILRGPNYYLNNIETTKKRMQMLSNLLLQNHEINYNQHKKISRGKLEIGNNKISVIRKTAIPFISEKIDLKRKSIISSLIPNFQNFAEKFVEDSKYPTSVIIIKNQKIIGFSSFYGSDYPFVFKSNVGSTLKPFIYYFAKKNGIDNSEKFDAYKNSLDWKVREASFVNSKLNIDDALFCSNNNSFINIANKVGINETLDFLSKILGFSSDEVFPSTILGATKNGISLFQLTLTYNKFLTHNIDSDKRDLMRVLNKIFIKKLNIKIDNAFLKTGTTNNNNERLAIIHHADTTYGFLRNENPENDYSKDGNIFKQIKRSFYSFIKPPKEYKWI